MHYLVEWSVHTMLESDMEKAFTHGDNTGMTATDTQKNTVYVIAKQQQQRCSAEHFATELAKHFIKTYPRVSKAKIMVEEKPWRRVTIDGTPHNHGYEMMGTEVRTAYITLDKAGRLDITPGVKDLTVSSKRTDAVHCHTSKTILFIHSLLYCRKPCCRHQGQWQVRTAPALLNTTRTYCYNR